MPARCGCTLTTDIGRDTDDACALAMILGWPDVDLLEITTTLGIDDGRAVCATHVLRPAGRDDVSVAAGAVASSVGSQATTWRACGYAAFPHGERPGRLLLTTGGYCPLDDDR